MVSPSLVIEQERRAIDERPGDVLSGREPADGGLLDAHFDVVPQRDEPRVGRIGFCASSRRSRNSLSLGSTGSGVLLALSASCLARSSLSIVRKYDRSMFFWAADRTSGAVATMARKSSGNPRPIGLAARVTDSRKRPSVQTLLYRWCSLNVSTVPPGPPIGSPVSKVAQWTTPVAG